MKKKVKNYTYKEAVRKLVNTVFKGSSKEEKNKVVRALNMALHWSGREPVK